MVNAIPAGTRAAFVLGVRGLAAARDWAGVAAALAPLDPAEVPPGLVLTYLVAASEVGGQALCAAALEAAIRAPLPPTWRAAIARRLAFEGKSQQAWQVLHADPAVLEDPACYPAAVQLLRCLASDGGDSPGIAAEATALERRLTRRVDAKPAPTAIRFAAGPNGARAGAPPTVILPAPGLAASVLDAYRAAARRFEGALDRRGRPNVTEWRDVLVNRRGQIWFPDGGVLLDSGMAIDGSSRAAAAHAPVVEVAAMAVEAHNSLYHWLADWLPSLAWRFEPGAPRVPVLVRDDARHFVLDSLRMVGGADLPLCRAGDAVLVRRLLVGSFGAGSIAPEGPHRRMIDAISAAADAAPEPAGGTARRLYISRRDTPRRRMANEAALEEALASRGFEAATLTPYSLAEKVRLMRGAEVVVGPHGAGMVMLMFARPGTRVLELMPATVGAAQLTSCMSRLSRLVGNRHHLWLEPVTPVSGHWASHIHDVVSHATTLAEGGTIG